MEIQRERHKISCSLFAVFVQYIVRRNDMEVDKDILEKEIQRVFKKLPSICCDVPAHLYIIDALCRKFKDDFGVEISTDY